MTQLSSPVGYFNESEHLQCLGVIISETQRIDLWVFSRHYQKTLSRLVTKLAVKDW